MFQQQKTIFFLIIYPLPLRKYFISVRQISLFLVCGQIIRYQSVGQINQNISCFIEQGRNSE
jgi:hypothetical protein